MAAKRLSKPTAGENRESRRADATLSPEEQADFEELKRSYLTYFQPANEAETRLVHEMSERQWWLRQVPWIESALYAMACRPAAEPSALPRLFTTRELERAVTRLRRYESGLLVRFEHAFFRLTELQRARGPMAAPVPVAPPKPGSNGPGGWTM